MRCFFFECLIKKDHKNMKSTQILEMWIVVLLMQKSLALCIDMYFYHVTFVSYHICIILSYINTCRCRTIFDCSSGENTPLLSRARSNATKMYRTTISVMFFTLLALRVIFLIFYKNFKNIIFYVKVQ